MRKWNLQGTNKEFHFIYELYKKGDFSFALKCILEYVEKYPRDFNAMLLQGKLFRLLKQNEEAKIVFFRMLSLFKEKKNVDITFVFCELIFLELDEYHYKEAFKYYNIVSSSSKFTGEISNSSLIRFLLLNQLGLYQQSLERENYSYYERQIIEYKEDELDAYLKHYAKEEKHYMNSAFKINEEVDLLELANRLKEILPYASKNPDYHVFDSYVFHYPDFVKDENGGQIDFIRVLALHENQEEHIIDIAPYQPCQYRIFINEIERLEIEKLLDSKLEKSRKKEVC